MRKITWNGWVILGMFVFMCVTAVGGNVGQDPQAREKAIWNWVAQVKEDDLRDTLQLFAHDALKGRGTLDGGSEFPSLFLRRELKKLGIAPLGDALQAKGDKDGLDLSRSYFQKFNFPRHLVVKENDKLVVKREMTPSRNVLGYIEGEKKDEWVILGAHYDHVGLGETGRRHGNEGDIFRGADDNGSGTVATLAVAEAFAKLTQKGIKPKRSILICFWGAEEWGEYGSQYFTRNFAECGIDKEKISGYINMDMVGRNETDKLFVLCGQVPNDAPEANLEKCKDLYDLAEFVNKKMKTGFTFSHQDTDSGFERSDQWMFYQVLRNVGRRIPCWQLFSGEHDDYHTPTDTWDKINYPKLARVARLAFGLAWQVSQMDGVPAYK